MKMQTIKKSIEINVPKERVWDVLLNDKFTRIWYAAFSQGSHAVTDWKHGSKAIFTDNTGNGLISKIITNEPNESLSMEYIGVVENGKEDLEGPVATALKGGRETYQLSENGSITHLAISCDMSSDMFDSMSSAWDKALQKLKELAETK